MLFCNIAVESYIFGKATMLRDVPTTSILFYVEYVNLSHRIKPENLKGYMKRLLFKHTFVQDPQEQQLLYTLTLLAFQDNLITN